MAKSKVVLWIALAALLVVAGFWALRGDFGEGADDLRAKRFLGSAYFEEGHFGLAQPILEEVADSSAATAQDLVNLACVHLAAPTGDQVIATNLLKQAARLDPNLASAQYCLGICARREGNYEQALQCFLRAKELDPEDTPAQYQLASTYEDLDMIDAAREGYEALVGLGLENGGSDYLVALYRLGFLLVRSQNPADRPRGRELMALKSEYENQGLVAKQTQAQELGNLGRVQPPEAAPVEGQAADGDPGLSYEKIFSGLAEQAGKVRAIAVRDVNGDQHPDLVVAGAGGVQLAIRQASGEYEIHPLSDAELDCVTVADLDHSGNSCVLGIAEEALRFWVPDSGWPPSTEAGGWPSGGFSEQSLFNLDDRVRDAVFVDQDHEGDLDLLVATDSGLFLWRNDGRNPQGSTDAKDLVRAGPYVFADISEAASLPRTAVRWIAIEDFDDDSDIDFLAAGEDGQPLLVSNLRKSRFEVLDPAVVGLPTMTQAPLLADFDQDGKVDVLCLGQPPVLYRNHGDGTFEKLREVAGLTLAPGSPAAVVDLNLDGEFDVVGTGEDGKGRVWLGSMLVDSLVSFELPATFASRSTASVADLDGDGDLDLVSVADPAGVDVLRCGDGDLGTALRIQLVGRKDCRQAVGVKVEVISVGGYQRWLYQGEPLIVGLGAEAAPEVVRVSWANGVVQHAIRPPPGEAVEMGQKEGVVGSCPFLYTWNGERYDFVSDVLGITPLGLPMVEGQYVPPDHDELVRIRGDQLGVQDGAYKMQITEELREVTYLDRAELWVVDHPKEIEIHPEERFTFPPFPPQKIHTIREALPVAATGSDGADWTANLQAIDGEHAVPFKVLRHQFQGLATPHHLDLWLPERVATAEKVRLVMTGWLFWSDASVNVATGHHAEYEFIPPMLLVPGADGEFVDSGPPLGFPAGKTKTMVIDITDRINRSDLRLRLFSTLRLYWDCIQVAVDDDSAPYKLTKLEPTQADLYFRGFSQPIEPMILEGESRSTEHPDWFDFDVLADTARWNQHPGMMTRYGDVLELLGEIDDCFVIFGAGDAVDLRFDAGDVPELESGNARTYLLFLDGWAKDRDHNTAWAETVEPLPFHGMSGYPYREDEHYPDDAVHRSYRERWNTRPGDQTLIPALSVGGAQN